MKTETLQGKPIPKDSFVIGKLSVHVNVKFIFDKFNYKIIENISSNAFQALWVEFLFEKKSNIVCGIIFRQHNSPESFQAYFDEALERFSLTRQFT